MSGDEILTPAEEDAFRARGLLVFDPGIPEASLDGVVADLAAGYDRSPSRPGLLNAHRLRNAWRRSAHVHQVALWPRTLAVLRRLYGREPLAFQTLNFLVGTEQAPHADTMHFATLPPGFVCGVWVALEDMDEGNGPLVYYPGSHLWPEPRLEDLGLPSSKRAYPRYTEALAARLREARIQPELALVRRGQAVVWHGNLAHGGARRRDPLRTRLSQVTHFFFAGCRFYTPMRSRGSSYFVRNPRPIRSHERPADVLAWARGYLDPWFLRHLVGQNLPHLAGSAARALLRR